MKLEELLDVVKSLMEAHKLNEKHVFHIRSYYESGMTNCHKPGNVIIIEYAEWDKKKKDTVFKEFKWEEWD
jgi:hypothetical protein